MKRIIAAIIAFLLPLSVFAAGWTATDNFESYTAGALNGDNGGSGWSAGYVANAAALVSILTPHTGSNSVLCGSTGAASCDATRTLTTGVTSGVYRVYIYAANSPTGTKGYYPSIFYDGSTLRFVIGWGVTGSTGNTVSFGDNASSWAVLSTTASAATWYYVDVQFDQANNRARASFNGGPWSAYITAAGGAYTQIDKWRLTDADGNVSDQGYHIDDIQVGTGPLAAFQLWPFSLF